MPPNATSRHPSRLGWHVPEPEAKGVVNLRHGSQGSQSIPQNPLVTLVTAFHRIQRRLRI